MEANLNVMEMINVMGFPIAACVALFWLLLHVLKTHSTLLLELKGSLDVLKVSLDNNTKTIQEISRNIERSKDV